MNYICSLADKYISIADFLFILPGLKNPTPELLNRLYMAEIMDKNNDGNYVYNFDKFNFEDYMS